MDLIIQIHSDDENSHYPLCDEVTNSTALTVGISLSCSVAYVITRFKSDIDKKFMKAQSLHQHLFRFSQHFVLLQVLNIPECRQLCFHSFTFTSTMYIFGLFQFLGGFFLDTDLIGQE